MSPDRETKIFKAFLISTALSTAMCLSGIFLGMSIRTSKLIQEQLLARARAQFDGIVLTRKWNALHGGVFVEKKKGVASNPYLRDPDVETTGHKLYTKRNPAVMTREISELAYKEGKFLFRITSLNPLNPDNKPDAFEQEALRLFETGTRELTKTVLIEDKAFFRYMAPLYVNTECMACHTHQGYHIGDVRGGISITFDIDDVRRKLRANTAAIVIFGVSTTAFLIALLWYFTSRLISRLAAARKELEAQARMDYLTGLFNRRHFLERFEEEFERAKRLGKSLGCIMLDIDHFKRVNDDHGHQTGDEVLKRVAKAISESIRPYDISGRFGGEEFSIILPDTVLADGVNCAERLREHIERQEVPTVDGGAMPLSVTISLGVSVLRSSDSTVDDVIRRADEGLYAAKRDGRNRVVAAN